MLLDPDAPGGVRRASSSSRADADEAGASLLARSEPDAEALARPRSAPRRAGVPGWLIVAVAAVTAIAARLVGVACRQAVDAAVASDTDAAQAAAERAIVPILSYDARDLDQSEAAATA